MAEHLANYILEENVHDAVEYCPKKQTFRLKLPVHTLPQDVACTLRGCSKESVSFFAGVKTRVRLLSASLLSGKVLTDMKDLGRSYNFTDCCLRMLEVKEARRKQLGQDFNNQFRRWAGWATTIVYFWRKRFLRKRFSINPYHFNKPFLSSLG